MADRQFDTTLPVRVDSYLLEDCKAAAKRDSRSLGSWVRLVLTDACANALAKEAQKKVRRKA